MVAGANIQYNGDEGGKGFEVMIAPKNPQKSSSAAMAHMNDLLDEALKQTFPASDPIAINVEHESPEYENGHNAGFPDPFSSTRKAPRRR